MERQAHYALVGMVTLIMLAALGFFTYWFIQTGFNSTYATYNVAFDFPVDGLNRGAEVHFNGIKVGEVTALKLGRDNSHRVVATVKVDAETPIKIDSVATLEPQGVTGLAYINISPGSGAALVGDPLKGPPLIHSTESRLSKLLSGSGSVIEDAYETLSRVNQLLSDRNIKAFSNSLANLESVTADLKAREQLLNDTHEAIVSAGQAADAVTALAQSTNTLMGEDAPRTLAKVNAAADKLASAAEEVERLSKKLEDPSTQMSETTLPQLETSLRNLDEATQALKAVADEARASPQGFAAKPIAKERRVKP